MQDEVQERYGYRPERVVMLSDEREPGWWDAVRLLGWYTPDHITEDTTAKYGRWYVRLLSISSTLIKRLARNSFLQLQVSATHRCCNSIVGHRVRGDGYVDHVRPRAAARSRLARRSCAHSQVGHSERRRPLIDPWHHFRGTQDDDRIICDNAHLSSSILIFVKP